MSILEPGLDFLVMSANPSKSVEVFSYFFFKRIDRYIFRFESSDKTPLTGFEGLTKVFLESIKSFYNKNLSRNIFKEQTRMRIVAMGSNLRIPMKALKILQRFRFLKRFSTKIFKYSLILVPGAKFSIFECRTKVFWTTTLCRILARRLPGFESQTKRCSFCHFSV